jgi:hypothetical protein
VSRLPIHGVSEVVRPVGTDDFRQVPEGDDSPETNLSRHDQTGRDPCSQAAKSRDGSEGRGEHRVPTISERVRQAETEQAQQSKT